ncbi:MAG: ABC transporter ATP-binding protein [bacterium]
MARIVLENVSFKYPSGSTPVNPFGRPQEGPPQREFAIRNVDLEIMDGQTEVFLGPSGCGKTTMLRLISGLERPTEGAIYYDDLLVNDLPVSKRNIGIVFQNYALYPHRKGRGNLSFFFEVHRREREVDEKVKCVAQVLGVDFMYLLGKKPKQLSGGQQQRVAIGRCIVRDPDMILMDEPLSNLDAKLRAQSRIEIKKLLRRYNVTSVYVTHDQVEASIMGDSICLMNEGTIVQRDTYVNLYNHPKNLFVAGFIGTVPMNFFDGTVDENGDVIRTAQFDIPVLEEWANSLRPGQGVVVGIRPEGFCPPQDVPESWRISARVILVEPFPTEGTNHVYLSRLEEEGRPVVERDFIASISMKQHIRRGETITVGVDRDKVHIFDRKTERAIN